jgi:hypothetical protein
MVKPLTWKTFEFFLFKPLHLDKTVICFWAIFLPFSKTSIYFWLNLYKLEKLIILPS